MLQDKDNLRWLLCFYNRFECVLLERMAPFERKYLIFFSGFILLQKKYEVKTSPINKYQINNIT
jgi:hypothetical protein